MTTPDRINAVMGARGVTRAALAYRLGVSCALVTRYLNGPASAVELCAGAMSVGNVATALGVDETALRTGRPCPVCS